MAPRLLDLECPCGFSVTDFYVTSPDVRVVHFDCHQQMEVVLKSPHRPAQWSDRDAVVVFRDSTGKIRYPARNDVPTPRGCERVEMRSLREVQKFEREHNVRNEAAWFDKGSGRGFDSIADPVIRSTERQRRERYLNG